MPETAPDPAETSADSGRGTDSARETGSAGPRHVRSLGVERPGQAYIWGYDEGPLEDGLFRTDTLYTGLSAGTELTFFKGTNPYLHGRYDGDWGVFREGEPSAGFPVPFLGYMEVGRVTASRTDAVRPGQVVGMTYGHKTGHTADPRHERVVPLPDGLDPVLGIYAAQMGPICANGLLHAAADLHGAAASDLGDGVRGRRVLVMGGGTIGLLLGRWAAWLGAAEVALADPTPERRDAARTLGLRALDGFDGAARWCKEHWHVGPGDRGADVVFQCRGQDAALNAALNALRPQGTVVDLAFYQGGAPQVQLGEAFHHNGLRIQCAQIGRVPRELRGSWTVERLAHETVRFLEANGGAIRQHVVTDVVPFDDAPDLMRDLADRKRHVIQAVFAVHGPVDGLGGSAEASSNGSAEAAGGAP